MGQLYRQALVTLFGDILYRVTIMLSMIIVARTTLPEIYAQFTLYYTTMLTVELVSISFFSIPLVKSLSDSKVDVKSVVFTVFICVFLFILLSVFILYWAYDYIGLKVSSDLFLIAIVYLAVNSVAIIYKSEIVASELFLFNAKNTAYSSLFLFVGTLLGFYFIEEPIVLMYSLVFSKTVYILLTRKKTKYFKCNLISKNIDVESIVNYLKSGFYILMSSVFVLPVLWWSNAVLARSNLIESGIYNTANQWHNIIMFIPGTIGTVLLPKLVKNKDENIIKHMLSMLIISSTVCMPLAMFSPFLVKLYNFDESYSYIFFIMFLLSIIKSQCNIFGMFIISRGRERLSFALNSFWALTFILIYNYLTQEVNSVSLLVNSLFISYVLLFVIEISIFLKDRRL